MNDEERQFYEAGKRAGKIDSLESAVVNQGKDIDKLKMAVWGLYGAIALAQFVLPQMSRYFGE